jgi:PTH1 family peptidyl-tRNA hydrolase
MPDERWIIAGLGNPGPQYAGNRHNAGAMVTALLAERLGARFKSHRTRNDIAEGRLSGQPVTLARPHAYMNLSGGPVAALAAFYKIPADRVVVVHDELDVPFDAVRLKLGGGDNGHNGLRSISAALGTRDYYRVRFGIGRPPGRMDPADFVLRDFSPAERKQLPFALDVAADAAEALLGKGLTEAQNQFHTGPLGPAVGRREPEQHAGGPAAIRWWRAEVGEEVTQARRAGHPDVVPARVGGVVLHPGDVPARAEQRVQVGLGGPRGDVGLDGRDVALVLAQHQAFDARGRWLQPPQAGRFDQRPVQPEGRDRGGARTGGQPAQRARPARRHDGVEPAARELGGGGRAQDPGRGPGPHPGGRPVVQVQVRPPVHQQGVQRLGREVVHPDQQLGGAGVRPIGELAVAGALPADRLAGVRRARALVHDGSVTAAPQGRRPSWRQGASQLSWRCPSANAQQIAVTLLASPCRVAARKIAAAGVVTTDKPRVP